MTDASSQLLEVATYCKPGDELRPSLIGLPDFTTTQVCPEEGDPEMVDTAYPDGWYVRIMFDELLDPSIEELTPIIDSDTGEPTGAFTGSIRGANPATIQCRSVVNNQFVNVDYDGYYSPSGNRVTWPVGPSLVFKPFDPEVIGTGTDCTITLNDSVRDKEGNPVPEAQRGPFPFKIAPVKVVALDPVDDPSSAAPVDALYLYYDNVYVQFNTNVDLTSLCPDADDDGLCDDESVFAFKDVAHPNEGPGYCDQSFAPCGVLADCPTTDGDTICGRGFCGADGSVCNTAADCPTADDHCGSTYAYDYIAFGLSDTEYGLGPVEPLQTEREYTFELKQGAVLRDRCGRETTLGEATAGDQTLVHFATNKFDLNSTTIVDGEIASGMKRLQYNFNNVLEGQDTASSGLAQVESTAIDATSATPAFTISPLPKKLTGPCPTTGACPLEDLATDELLVISGNFDGQTQLQGHLQMNTEYTATLKAGTVVKDFYGASWTAEADQVITWKTQPAIVMTGIVVRNTNQFFSIGNNGTLIKNVAGNTTDVRFSFNASIDPQTLELAEIKIEPAVAGIAFATPAGCGNFSAAADNNATGVVGACTLRLRGEFAPGTYTITLLAGATVKDVFGLEYVQAADQSITVTIADAGPSAQCL